jgi:hemerythrin-like domain-containing protein
LLDALEDCGFAHENGPIGSMYAGHQKSREISGVLIDAARQWQGGDEGGRAEVIYAASEYTQVMHQHFDLLRDLIHPLLEQSLSADGELKAAEELNHIAFDEHSPDSLEKYIGMVKMLEEEVETWK